MGRKKALRRRKKSPFASPYSLWETLTYIKRNILGPTRKNKAHVEFIPEHHELSDVEPETTICFVGDIMALHGLDLGASQELREFIGKSDALVGNFEATITDEPPVGFDQKQEEKVLDQLGAIFPTSRTFLSVANNHGGDFGRETFEVSVRKLEEHGFTVFGTKKAPKASIGGTINLVGATRWSNRPQKYLSMLKNAREHSERGKFNVLYPHWGFELECYPRKKTARSAGRLLGSFDAIVGQHPHTPQPVTEVDADGLKKLVAYSLGDFCYCPDEEYDHGGLIRVRNYLFGIVLKVTVGRTPGDTLAAGSVDWRFVKSQFDPDDAGKTSVVLVDGIPCFS
ncbi:MAG: CapA family protein [Promethearchaeota archaeon]